MMDPVCNPFAPGAGQRPPELAGRDRGAGRLRRGSAARHRAASGLDQPGGAQWLPGDVQRGWAPLAQLWDQFPRLYGSSANRTGQPPAASAADAVGIVGTDALVVDGDALRDLGSAHAASTMVRVAPDGELGLYRQRRCLRPRSGSLPAATGLDRHRLTSSTDPGRDAIVFLPRAIAIPALRLAPPAPVLPPRSNHLRAEHADEAELPASATTPIWKLVGSPSGSPSRPRAGKATTAARPRHADWDLLRNLR